MIVTSGSELLILDTASRIKYGAVTQIIPPEDHKFILLRVQR